MSIRRVSVRGDFWSHVQKSDGCWEWVGARNPNGYGNHHAQGRTRKAHRVSWEMEYGPIPEGMLVLHRCDNPPCVRPDHLFLGTQRDNLRDAIAKGRWNSPKRVRSYAVTAQKLSARSGPSGESNPNARLTAAEVASIRTRYASGLESQSRIAADYGITQVNVSHIVRGLSWRE